MIKIDIIKASVPGFTKTFDSVEDAAQELDGNVCSGCKTTKGELLSTYSPDKMSEEALNDFEIDLDESLPNDWKEYSAWDRIRVLLGTACGCEFDIEAYDD